METNQTLDNIKKTYLLGFRGIIRIAAFKKNYLFSKAGLIILTISILSSIILFYLKVDLFLILVELKNVMIQFLPNILGFTIAGYSLVVGFVQSNMLNLITEKVTDSDFSIYQKMSAIFATNIVLQCISLFVAFGFHFIGYVDKDLGYLLNDFACFRISVNLVGTFILTYFFLLSLFITAKIIENIFNFSQLHQYVVNKEKLKNNNSNNEPKI